MSQREVKESEWEMCLWGVGLQMKRDVYEQWKERSGFLVALFGFCGSFLLCCNALRLKNSENKKAGKRKKECVWQKRPLNSTSLCMCEVWSSAEVGKEWKVKLPWTFHYMTKRSVRNMGQRRETWVTWARPGHAGGSGKSSAGDSQSKAAADVGRSQEGWVA